MINVAAGLLLVVDPVLAGDCPDLVWGPGEEGPSGEVGAVDLCIAGKNLWRVALGVDGDGEEENLGTEVVTEVILQGSHLGGQEGAGVGTGGIDEGDHDHLAVQLVEREPPAVLGRQGKGRSRSDLRKPRTLFRLMGQSRCPPANHQQDEQDMPRYQLCLVVNLQIPLSSHLACFP